MSGPRIARITVYPVKSLDGKAVDAAHFTPTGSLTGDRVYALFDADGDVVNGKTDARLHRIRSGFDLDAHRLCVRDVDATPADAVSFSLPDEAAAGAWFSHYLGYPVELRRAPRGGYPDDTTNPGPTVISTATLETVAGWYDDVTADEMRRRLRASLEVDGVPAFWEDRLYGDEDEVVRFRVGDHVLEGVAPCQRCVVPTRDPDTGEPTPDFRERFVSKRRETKPAWTDGERFDHDYRLMVNTRVPAPSGRIDVGDGVEVLGTVAPNATLED